MMSSSLGGLPLKVFGRAFFDGLLQGIPVRVPVLGFRGFGFRVWGFL